MGRREWKERGLRLGIAPQAPSRLMGDEVMLCLCQRSHRSFQNIPVHQPTSTSYTVLNQFLDFKMYSGWSYIFTLLFTSMCGQTFGYWPFKFKSLQVQASTDAPEIIYPDANAKRIAIIGTCKSIALRQEIYALEYTYLLFCSWLMLHEESVARFVYLPRP